MATRRMEWQVGFTADTTQLKRQLNDIKLQLRDISSLKFADKSFPLTEQMEQASLAAGDLLQKLNQATNVQTGNLDLTKFRQSLEASGKTLSQYQQELSSIGETGQRAFLSVAASIANAEPPFRRVSALTEKMAITLKNTLRWQISSSALRAFTGAIETAYGYAKDLNESLNNIRIVSGKSVEQMSRFAEDANKAAARLSSTTLDYTNAALIFFQQGLSEDEVKRRTDVTLQLAEVTGDSVETVSSQLTAIWNNFSDGSDDLARYADVLTRLGAVTASSSDEIAEGMQKFSAVANTVGLSYDYAAAALATLTATTRESADVVGTSLRTIFARLESLQLGETLDDGVTLTKYSEALHTAGVEVLDVNGKIKDMNTILDETMQAWAGLDQTQRTALATTVAGVRQYAQFIALMDNQDFFRQNVQEAEQATGTLKQQASIYAESWEAARHRVKNAAQDIYDSLIDEKFFIQIDNLTADFLHTIADMLDGLGGMRGVILALGGIFTTVFQKQLAQGLRNAAFNLSLFTKQQQKSNEAFQTEAANILANATWASAKDKGLATQLGLLQQINEVSENLTEQERLQGENLAHLIGQETELVEASRQELTNREKMANQISSDVLSKTKSRGARRTNFGVDFAGYDSDISSTYAFLSGDEYAAKGMNKRIGGKTLSGILSTFSKLTKQISAMEDASGRLKTSLGENYHWTGQLTDSQAQMFEETATQLGALQINFDRTGANYEELEGHIKNAKVAQEQMYQVLLKLMEQEGVSADDAIAALEQLKALMQESGSFSNKNESDAARVAKLHEVFQKVIDKGKSKNVDWATSTIQVANAMFNLGQVITTTKDLVSQFNDGTATLAGTLTGLGSIIMSIVQLAPAIKGLKSGIISLGKTIMEAFGVSAVAAGVLVAAIAAVAIGIGAAIVYAIKKSQEAEQNLKRVQERVQETKESFDEAKQSYDNLVSGNEDYNVLLKQLDALAAGSKAFEDQLIKVNEEAEKLIDLLPELEKYTYYDENGVLRFKPEAEDIIKAQEQRVNFKEFSASISQAEADRQTARTSLSVAGIQEQLRPFAQSLWTYTRVGQTQTAQQKAFSDRYTALVEEGDFLSTDWDELIQDMQEAGFATGFTSVLEEARRQIADYKKLQQENLSARTAAYRNLASKQDLSSLSDAGRIFAQNISAAPSAFPTGLDRLGVLGGYSEEDYNKKYKGQTIQSLSGEDRVLGTMISQYLENQGIEMADNLTFDEVYKLLNLEEGFAGWTEFLTRLYGEETRKISENIIKNAEQYEEQLDTLPGATENVKKVLTQVLAGNQTDLSGLSLDEIEYIQKHSDLILTTLGQTLDIQGREQNKAWLEGWLTETVNTSLDEAKVNIKNSLKAFVGGLGDLFEELEAGTAIEDLEGEALDNYNTLAGTYSKYLTKIENMDKDSYAYRESLRDLFDLAYAESVQKLVEAEASGFEILQASFKNLDKQIDSSLDVLEDYFNTISLVPQDLKLSFSEVRELIEQGHGAILKSAEFTTEGQIKLNKDEVQKYLEGLHEKYVGDLEQRKATLEFQKNLLQTELDNYKKMEKGDKVRYLAGIEGNSLFANSFDLLSDIGVNAISDITSEVATLGQTLIDCTTGAQQLVDKLSGKDIDYEALTTVGQRLRRTLEDSTPRLINIEDFEYQGAFDSLADEERFDDIDQKFQDAIQDQIDWLDTLISITQQAIDDTDIWNNLYKSLGTEEQTDAQKKLLDAIKDTIERYHELNRALQNIEREYSRIEKLTDRLYGKEHLDSLAQEGKILQDQIKLQQKKLLVVEANAAIDFERIKELVPKVVMGEDGEIANYTEILTEARKEYQAAAEYAQGLSEEELENYQETLDALQQKYEDIQEALQQYEETLDTMHELEDDIREGKFLVEDNRLEQLTYKLQLVLDVKENKDAIDEFGKKLAESFGDYLTHGQTALDFDAQLSASNSALLPHLKQQWEDLAALYNETNDFADRASIVEELKSTRDQIYSTLEALLDYVDTLENALPEAIDAARERFNAMIDQLDHTKTIYDSIKELTELQGLTENTEEGFARLQDIARKSLEAEILNTRMQKEWYENAYSRLMEAEAALAQVQEGDDTYDLLKNARDALLEEYNEAQEAMMESAISAMEKARDMFEAQIEKAKNDFSKALTSGLGLDAMQDRYDRYIDTEERYLDVVNEQYEVNKWNRKLQEQIDKANSASAIDRLKELQKEIEVRRANNTLSQYDLDILNAKYEMTLKQIALEEAQSSATNMRLQRDSQGNWNYVYTADYDAVIEAQQEFEDASNNYYNIAKQQVKDVTQEILDTWQECADKIAEIYQDETLTVEEREARIAEIRAYYADKVRALEEEKNVALQDIYDASKEIADYYQDIYNQGLDDMSDRNGDFVTDFGDNIQTMLDDMANFLNNFTGTLGDMTGAAGNFEQAFNNYLQQASNAAQDYRNTVDRVAQETGTSLDQLQNHSAQVTDTVTRLNQSMSNSYWQLGNAGVNAIDSIWNRLPSLNQVTSAFASQTASIYETIRAYQQWIAMQSMQIFPQETLINQPKAGTTQGGESEYYVPHFARGGYTGPGNEPIPAVLHGSEYVLNKEDTTKILSAAAIMKSLNVNTLLNIIETLKGRAVQDRGNLGEAITTPGFRYGSSKTVQQSVVINADFPNATDSEEIKEAFDNLINRAIQYTELKQ